MEIIRNKKKKIIVSLLLLISLTCVSVNSFAATDGFGKNLFSNIGDFLVRTIESLIPQKETKSKITEGVIKFSNILNTIFSEDNATKLIEIASDSLKHLNNLKTSDDVLQAEPQVEVIPAETTAPKAQIEIIPVETLLQDKEVEVIPAETEEEDVVEEEPTVPEETQVEEIIEEVQTNNEETNKKYTYTIVFNSNGGDGTMDNFTITYGESTQIPQNEYKRKGCKFLGWYAKKIENGTTKCFGYNSEGKRGWYNKEELNDTMGYCGYYIYKDNATVASQAKSGTVTMTAIWYKEDKTCEINNALTKKEDNSTFAILNQNVGIKILSEGETRNRIIFEAYLDKNDVKYDSSSNIVKVTVSKTIIVDYTEKVIGNIYIDAKVVFLGSKKINETDYYYVRIQGMMSKDNIGEKEVENNVIGGTEKIQRNNQKIVDYKGTERYHSASGQVFNKPYWNLEEILGNISRYLNYIAKYSKQNNVDPRWVMAIIAEESGGIPTTTNSVPCTGLMGLSEKYCGTHKELVNPEINIKKGTEILGNYTKKYGVWDGMPMCAIGDGNWAATKRKNSVATVNTLNTAIYLTKHLYYYSSGNSMGTNNYNFMGIRTEWYRIMCKYFSFTSDFANWNK